MCVRGMQAKMQVLPFQDTLFGDHYIFQPNLIFLFCEFFLLQKGRACSYGESCPVCFRHTFRPLHSKKGTIKFYGKPQAARLPWDLP